MTDQKRLCVGQGLLSGGHGRGVIGGLALLDSVKLPKMTSHHFRDQGSTVQCSPLGIG